MRFADYYIIWESKDNQKMELRIYKSDLHIHTCLSPCADLYMTPKRIIAKAIEKGIDIIGICDHNSAENVPYVMEAGKKYGVSVIGGMEITTSEEVHLLGLFSDYEKLLKMQNKVYEELEGENNEKLFGVQAVVNEYDEVLSLNNKLLIGATKIPLKTAVEYIHKNDGIAICSHIDREGYGIIGKLGFIPSDLEIDAIELSPLANINQLINTNPEINNFSAIFSSDAHTLEQIGKTFTAFLLAYPCFEEIKLALKELSNREIRCFGVC